MPAVPALPDTLTLYPSAGALAAAHQEDAILLGASTFAHVMTALGSLSGGRFVESWVPALLVRRLLRSESAPGATAERAAWVAAARDARGVLAVTQALLEVRRAGVTAGALAEHKGSTAWTRLAGVLGEYEDILEAEHCYDVADRERQAILRAATNTLPAYLQHVRYVRVVCGTEVFGARLDLLNAFAARGLHVHVTLPWDPARPQAFAWPEAMLQMIETRGHQALKVSYDDRSGSGPLQRLRAAQFTATSVGPVPVDLMEVPIDGDHVDHCVQRVATWVAAGVPLQQIAVVLPDMAGQATGIAGHTLVAALAAAGIAAQCAAGLPLWDRPLARGLVGLMRLAHHSAHGFNCQELAQAWRLWGAPIVTEAGSFGIEAVAGWLSMAPVAYLRVGGVERALIQAAAGQDSAAAQRSAAPVAGAVEHFMTRIAAWPLTALLNEHFTCVAQWTAIIGDQAKHRVAACEVMQILNGLLQAAEYAKDPTPWLRDECASWLMALFQASAVAPKSDCLVGVVICAAEDVVGRCFAHLLLVGANTGLFPRVAAPDPVMTDTLRAEINTQLGPRLIQFAPLSGRGTLPAEARDTWLWLEMLAACTTGLAITVMCGAGEADTGQSDVVEALRHSSTPRVWPLQPSYQLAQPATDDGWLRHAVFVATTATVTATAPTAPTVTPTTTVTPTASAADPCRVVALPASTPKDLRIAWESLQRRQRCNRLCDAGQVPLLTPGVQQAWRSFIQAHVHSVSRLDALGVCRYRHFAATGLGLQRPEGVHLGSGQAGRGRVAHAAVHAVYQALLQNGGLVAARRAPQAAWLTARQAFAKAQPALMATTQAHVLLQPALLMDAWHAVEVQLGRDLASEAGEEPIALEYTFGATHAASAPPLRLYVPAAAAWLQVRGTIDRVDVVDKALHALDYKSTVRARQPGRHFQLGLYAAVALRDLQNMPSAVHTAWLGLWNDTRRNGGGDRPEADPEQFIAALQADLGQRLGPSLAGDISPDPDETSACTHCDFLALCRHGSRLTIVDEIMQEAEA